MASVVSLVAWVLPKLNSKVVCMRHRRRPPVAVGAGRCPLRERGTGHPRGCSAELHVDAAQPISTLLLCQGLSVQCPQRSGGTACPARTKTDEGTGQCTLELPLGSHRSRGLSWGPGVLPARDRLRPFPSQGTAPCCHERTRSKLLPVHNLTSEAIFGSNWTLSSDSGTRACSELRTLAFVMR